MNTYEISLGSGGNDFQVVKIAFGEPATNDQIVVDATTKATNSVITDAIAGKICCINGPASLPVAVALSHAWVHRCAAIAVWDPKLAAYVVAVSHDPRWSVGQLVTF